MGGWCGRRVKERLSKLMMMMKGKERERSHLGEGKIKKWKGTKRRRLELCFCCVRFMAET